MRFLVHAAGSIQRILPHVEVTGWTEVGWKPSAATYTSNAHNEIRIIIAIGNQSAARAKAIEAKVYRRISVKTGAARPSLHVHELGICKRIVERIAEVLEKIPSKTSDASLEAIGDAFDGNIIAYYVAQQHKLIVPGAVSIGDVLGSLRKLSEQSYENKALTFGCVIHPRNRTRPENSVFPKNYMEAKKYKALSDGFRTAYKVSSFGAVIGFIDLEEKKAIEGLSEKHYYPEWAKGMAGHSLHGACGISLSRQGDLLIFEDGSLRFTYRYGQWQYWNHHHLVNLLRDRARVQKIDKKVLGNVIGSLYRAAIDVSFRRSGALFVILKNQGDIHEIVRQGDAISDDSRNDKDRDFDRLLKNKKIQSLSRAALVELSSLDGAVVLTNSGRILAYGAVLQPKKNGKIKGSEGSRTKAAIGASNYGLAIKISSDGEISVYHYGAKFIAM